MRAHTITERELNMTVRITSLCLLVSGAFLAMLFLPLGEWKASAAPLQQGNAVLSGSEALPTPTSVYTVFLPLIEKHSWVDLPLANGGFEEDWETESSHQALRVNSDEGSATEIAVANILTPPGWLTWFRQGVAYHESDGDINWGQPEVHSVNHHNPDRMSSGLRGELLFTFYRVHDAGFLQQVDATPGQQFRLRGWAHAWSNNAGAPTPDNPDDPFWSEGSHVGFNQFSAPEDTDGLDEADRNFTFILGIDPTGGTNPLADTVIWGQGLHIYNGYKEVPAVTATAQGSEITIFLRSRTLWRYKHNDAYWDDISLQVVQ
jgi:hypothetical protein